MDEFYCQKLVKRALYGFLRVLQYKKVESKNHNTKLLK